MAAALPSFVVLGTIVRDFPKGFWEDLRTASRQTYSDIYHQVAADPNLVDEQRLDELYQVRHFRMEHLLLKLANQHDIPCTTKMVTANNRSYVFVTSGSIGLTQAYVQAISAMPKPAAYRAQLAAMNQMSIEPGLDLGDEPREVKLLKDFYGLLAHNPVGKRFTEQDQRLGMVQFCVTVDDFSSWAVELTMEEIISAYEVAKPEPKTDRSMPWKTIPKKGTDDE